MSDRVKWACPQCAQAYMVRSIANLTVCPACQELNSIVQDPSPSRIPRRPLQPALLAGNNISPLMAIADILDLRFKRYLTPIIIICITWCMALALMAIFLVLFITSLILEKDAQTLEREAAANISRPFAMNQRNQVEQKTALTRFWDLVSSKFIRLLATTLATIVTLMYVRVLMEALIVVFNIASTLNRLERIGEELLQDRLT